MEMQQLNLCERDFALIIEALDHLPQKNIASDLMTDILKGMVATSEEERKQIVQEKVLREIKQKAEKEALIEEVRILQGKLLLFKRTLIEKNALNQVDEILSR